VRVSFLYSVGCVYAVLTLKPELVERRDSSWEGSWEFLRVGSFSGGVSFLFGMGSVDEEGCHSFYRWFIHLYTC
jgi:hypothetical protein